MSLFSGSPFSVWYWSGLRSDLDVDRGAVQRRRDGLRQERTVVVGVVPGKAALVHAVLPQAGHELDQFDRLLGVDDHGLAVGLDFLAAPRPQVGIGEARRVAERVAERLAERPALGLQLLGDLAIGLPGVGELGGADFVEPRLAVGDHAADHRPRHAHEDLAVAADGFGIRKQPALALGDFVGERAHVDDAVGIEMGVAVERHDQVGTGARLDGGRDARLQIVAVHRLELHLDAEVLLGRRHQLLVEHLIGRRHEVDPLQPVDGLLLGVGRHAAGRQDARHPA